MGLRLNRNILIASVVGVLGLGLYFGTRLGATNPTPSENRTATSKAMLEPVNQGQALLKYSLATDLVRTYAMMQDMSVEFSPAEGQSTVSQINVRGQFDEQLVSAAGSVLTYRYKFREIRFESNDARGQPAMPPAEAEKIARSLSDSTLLLTTDAQRSNHRWSVSAQTSLETLNLLRSVVLSGSVFLPNSKELSEWTGIEEDSTGVFTHSNRLKSLVDGKALIEKEPRMVRVQADALQANAAAQNVVVLPSSLTKIDFDAKAGHLMKSDQRWTLRMQTPGILATTNIHTQIDFQSQRAATEEEKQIPKILAGSGDQSKGEFFTEFELQAAHSTSVKQKVAAQKLAGENWSSLRSRFMSPEFHKDGAARAQFFEQLSALLYLQPELCTTVTNEIATLDKKDPDYKSKLSLLAGVFSSQETPEAEAAMVALAERLKDDSTALMQVIPALAAHRNPSERTRDALVQTYSTAVDEGVKSTATLALGTFASRAKNGRPDLNRETVDRLKQDFDSAPSVDKKVTISGALGNAGAREALESVKNLMSASQDASLKRSAIYDLRFVDDPEVDSLLEKIVLDTATDPDLVVQGVRVMRMRPPLKRHLQTATTLFRTKTARPTLRSEALYTASYLTPVAPAEVRQLLEEASKDSNAQIAKQAVQLLARQAQAL